MELKKRRTILSLLKYYDGRSKSVAVTINGCQTGLVLYDGPLMYVPYHLCIDYVLSYKYIDGHLEIIDTCVPKYGVL
jgi:hypothetical protein